EAPSLCHGSSPSSLQPGSHTSPGAPRPQAGLCWGPGAAEAQSSGVGGARRTAKALADLCHAHGLTSALGEESGWREVPGALPTGRAAATTVRGNDRAPFSRPP
ncbi:unnamed protein product, partial [Gulo gulo]